VCPTLEKISKCRFYSATFSNSANNFIPNEYLAVPENAPRQLLSQLAAQPSAVNRAIQANNQTNNNLALA